MAAASLAAFDYRVHGPCIVLAAALTAPFSPGAPSQWQGGADTEEVSGAARMLGDSV